MAVAASKALLERGYGRPAQAKLVEGIDNPPPRHRPLSELSDEELQVLLRARAILDGKA